MMIHKVRLRNFCCFEDRRLTLAERFNLLVGDNGSGKTSILDGLAVGVGALFLGLPESTVARHISRDEVRFRSYVQGDSYTREKQFPSVVECRGTIDDQSGPWSRELNSYDGRTTRQHAAWIEAVGSDFDYRVRADKPVVLPVVSYYGTGRLWLKKKKTVSPLPPGSRFLGYRNCLDPASDENWLHGWFKTAEIQALQEKRPIAVLEAVRGAVRECIGDATHVWFNVAKDELLLRFTDREVPFDYLSDGYRNMLDIVADIAVRCATLNPALKEHAVRNTPGVVLIDEIDLHLHPKWQRRVVADLMRAFPKIQFVATTHSPFIIQSLVSDAGTQLINLDNPDARAFADRSVEDIAEEVQGVELPQRSQRFLDMMAAAERYYAALRDAERSDGDDLERLKQKLDELSLPFSDDPAYQAFLHMQLSATGIDTRNGHAAG